MLESIVHVLWNTVIHPPALLQHLLVRSIRSIHTENGKETWSTQSFFVCKISHSMTQAIWSPVPSSYWKSL